MDKFDRLRITQRAEEQRASLEVNAHLLIILPSDFTVCLPVRLLKRLIHALSCFTFETWRKWWGTPISDAKKLNISNFQNPATTSRPHPCPPIVSSRLRTTWILFNTTLPRRYRTPPFPTLHYRILPYPRLFPPPQPLTPHLHPCSAIDWLGLTTSSTWSRVRTPPSQHLV